MIKFFIFVFLLGTALSASAGSEDIIDVRLDEATAVRILKDQTFVKNYPRLAQAIGVGVATTPTAASPCVPSRDLATFCQRFVDQQLSRCCER